MEILEVKTISKIWSIPTCALLGLRGRSCGEMESRRWSKESGVRNQDGKRKTSGRVKRCMVGKELKTREAMGDMRQEI